MAKTLSKENINPTTFLDCGSGTGLLGAAVLKKWPQIHVTGIDFAADMLLQSQSQGSAQATILHNLMDTPWPVFQHGFDIVGAAAIINYAPDPYHFIAQMAQASKDKGYIILSYLTGQQDREGVTDDGSKVYLWSRKEMEKSFTENGINFISNRETRSYSGRICTGWIRFYWAG